MRMDKLTTKFQQALADAQSLAVGRDHQFIEPAHVMLALLDTPGGTARPLLMKAGADTNRLRSELGTFLDRLARWKATRAACRAPTVRRGPPTSRNNPDRSRGASSSRGSSSCLAAPK